MQIRQVNKEAERARTPLSISLDSPEETREGFYNKVNRALLADLLEANEAIDEEDFKRLEDALLSAVIHAAGFLVAMDVPLDQRLQELQSYAIKVYRGELRTAEAENFSLEYRDL